MLLWAQLLDAVAAVLLRAPPDSPWSREAEVRTALRQRWCLQGEPWEPSDQRAAELVLAARRKAGIATPTGFDQEWHKAGKMTLETAAEMRQEAWRRYGRKRYAKRKAARAAAVAAL